MKEYSHYHGHRSLMRIDMNCTEEKRSKKNTSDYPISADETSPQKSPAPQFFTDSRTQANHWNSEPPRPLADHVNYILHAHIKPKILEPWKHSFGQQICTVAKHNYCRKTDNHQDEITPTGPTNGKATPPFRTDHQANGQKREGDHQNLSQEEHRCHRILENLLEPIPVFELVPDMLTRCPLQLEKNKCQRNSNSWHDLSNKQ